jgi:TolB-like protein/Flp pilus assembly protein TadD
VVLYEMATGRAPFQGNTTAILFEAILNRSPVPPLKVKADLPAHLEMIIGKALEKDRELRCQTASELRADLKRLKRDTDSSRSAAVEVAPAPVPARKPYRRGLILGLVSVVLVTLPMGYLAVRPKPIDSLAVMPFVNAGADPSAEYLSDGITENLINSLSQLPKLRVVPRTLVLGYKGREMDPRKVGQDLHVRAILTGRVVHRGDSLNIQTELVDVGEVSQLWGQQYDRKFTDILAIQEDIAKQISEKLHLRPSGEEQKRLAKRATQNTEAYQLYLKGRYYWNRRTGDLLKKANEYFQQAIDKDPTYSLAWAGLAQSYALFGFYEVLSPAESCPKARAAALKALDIDASLSETHAALGWINMTCDWDWPGSGRELKRALEIKPDDAIARLFYGQYLWAIGRLEDGIAARRRALEADPLSPIISTVLGQDFYYTHRYDSAVEQLRKTLDFEPNFAQAHLFLGMAYEQKGKVADAIAELQQAVTLSGVAPRYMSALGHAYAVSGKTKMAEESLSRLQVLARQRYVAPYDLAEIHIGLGQKQRALDDLENAYSDRSGWIIFLREDPRFDAIRGEARYLDLLRGMHQTP